MPKRFSHLFQQYYTQAATGTEREEFLRLLKTDAYDELLQELIDGKYHDFEATTSPFTAAAEQRMLANILEYKSIPDSKNILKHKNNTRKLFPRWAVAAAIFFMILSAAVMLNRYAGEGWYRDLNTTNKYVNDIPAPKGSKATLTLQTGEVINLNNAKTGVVIKASKLIYNDSSKIMGSATVTGQLTITTPRGGQYEVKLPDGTTVMLNAASSLQFPSAFDGLKERRVILTGEGYFKVAHNSKKPFRVQTASQVVEDIGTEFNINAYTDEGSTKTTLVEGSASVNGTTIVPNQQATLQGENLQVKTIDPELAIAWKNNNFIFENQDIKYIMRMIERWYNVTVIYDGPAPTEKFGGAVSRLDNVSSVLRILEATKGVRFKIEGRTISVSKF